MAPSSTFAFFHCHYAFQKFPFFVSPCTCHYSYTIHLTLSYFYFQFKAKFCKHFYLYGACCFQRSSFYVRYWEPSQLLRLSRYGEVWTNEYGALAHLQLKEILSLYHFVNQKSHNTWGGLKTDIRIERPATTRLDLDMDLPVQVLIFLEKLCVV